MNMTKRDIAGYLGIDVKTLRNWKKERQNLYKTVMKGLAFDDMIEKAERNLAELKEMQNDFGKIPPQYLKS